MEPKIRLKGFRDKWNQVTIGDVATIIGGGTPSTSNPKFWGGSILWFTPTEVGHNKYVKESERTITQEGLEGSSAKIIPANSILLSSRATIGEASINTCSCSTNQGFQSLVPINTDLEFLYSLILTKKGELIKESNGSTFLEISGNKVRSIKISIPEINEQQIIGSYFQHLDSLIQATAKKIESLKQVKVASLQSMFPQEGETAPRVRFKGFEGDWEKATIRDICSFTKGQGYSKSDLKNEGCPIILYGRMYTSYSFEMNDIDTFAKHKEGAVYSKGNEVIIPASGETAEDIAIAAAVKQKGVILGGDINILVFNDGYDPSFMALLISYSKTHYELSKYAQGKSVVHLRNNDIANGHVTCPSMEEQKQISSFFSKLDSQITLLSQRLEKLKQIKSACLDNMFV